MATSERDRVLALCGTLPGAALEFPFGEDTSVFKVGGKMFALIGQGESPGSVNLKCDPDEAAALVRAHDAIVPGYHMNKRHWITVRFDGSVPPAFVDDLVADSYELVVASLPKRLRPT